MERSAHCRNKICEYLGDIPLHLTENESSDSDDSVDQNKRPKLWDNSPASRLTKLIQNFNRLQPTRQYNLGFDTTTSDLFSALTKCIIRDYPQVELLINDSDSLAYPNPLRYAIKSTINVSY